MALKNLKAHYKRLEEQISEAKQEYRACEDKYRKMEKERDDLYKRFKKAVQEIQRKAELGKNMVLEKKLEELAQQFEETLGSAAASKKGIRNGCQRSTVLGNAKLDPSIVANVTKKLEQDLQYQVHQATKQYNDTIRVYESKLQGLGVEPEEIGFEAIQTATSLMPARLVMGDFTFYAYMEPSYSATMMASYVEVDPSSTRLADGQDRASDCCGPKSYRHVSQVVPTDGGRFQDAGQVYFNHDTVLDLNRSYSFKLADV
eukprot:g27501.t1